MNPPNPRIQSLDYLRFLAMLLVMFRHGDIQYHLYIIGWIGVDLFFVLSGFLISGLIFQEYKQQGSVDFYRFFCRRAFKILPTFWLALWAHGLYFQWKGMDSSSSRWLAEFFFLQDYFPNILGISWSLAVEEQFYLVLAGISFFLIRHGKLNNWGGIPLLCFGAAGLCLTLRLTQYLFRPFHADTHLFPFHLRADTLFFGVFLSWLFHFRKSILDQWCFRLRSWLLAPLGFALIAVCLFPVESAWMNTIGFSLLYLGFGGLLIWALQFDTLCRLPGFTFFARLGKSTYAMYLFHLLVGPAAANFARTHIQLPFSSEWLNDLIYVATIVLVGVIITRIFENPILRYRDRHFPRFSRSS